METVCKTDTRYRIELRPVKENRSRYFLSEVSEKSSEIAYGNGINNLCLLKPKPCVRERCNNSPKYGRFNITHKKPFRFQSGVSQYNFILYGINHIFHIKCRIFSCHIVHNNCHGCCVMFCVILTSFSIGHLLTSLTLVLISVVCRFEILLILSRSKPVFDKVRGPGLVETDPAEPRQVGVRGVFCRIRIWIGLDN